MALSSGDFLVKLCDEFLSCNICMEDFDSHTRKPCILPCFHTFCSLCLSQLSKEGKLQCPNCRHVAHVEGQIPRDPTRMSLLDFKQAISQEGPECDGCQEGAQARASHRCQECEEYLCGDCGNAHSKVRLTRNHSLLALTEARKTPAKLVQVSYKCDRHPDKKLELYCSTCRKAVCVICCQTMHRQCQEVVELESVLEGKKKELQSVCEKLESIEESCHGKAEESDACLEQVDRNLREGEAQVVMAFSRLMSALMERQDEVLEAMRDEAKGHRLQLQDQASSFHSLQAAAQTTAQYGRRVLALGLAPQLLDQKTGIEKTAEDLGAKHQASVQPAPHYSFQIPAEKFEEVKMQIDNLRVWESYIRDATMAREAQTPHISCPPFTLDSQRSGPGCQVSADGHTLVNRPSVTEDFGIRGDEVFKFPGTCGTEAVSIPAAYWQVRCKITPNPKMTVSRVLCELGVATEQALKVWPGTDFLSKTEHCAVTVGIGNISGQVTVAGFQSNQCLTAVNLASSSLQEPLDQTLGFLLDKAGKRIHILDVTGLHVLWSRDVDLTSPLLPVVRANSEDFSGGAVELELQTGQEVNMTHDLSGLLAALLTRNPQ